MHSNSTPRPRSTTIDESIDRDDERVTALCKYVADGMAAIASADILFDTQYRFGCIRSRWTTMEFNAIVGPASAIAPTLQVAAINSSQASAYAIVALRESPSETVRQLGRDWAERRYASTNMTIGRIDERIARTLGDGDVESWDVVKARSQPPAGAYVQQWRIRDGLDIGKLIIDNHVGSSQAVSMFMLWNGICVDPNALVQMWREGDVQLRVFMLSLIPNDNQTESWGLDGLSPIAADIASIVADEATPLRIVSNGFVVLRHTNSRDGLDAAVRVLGDKGSWDDPLDGRCDQAMLYYLSQRPLAAVAPVRWREEVGRCAMRAARVQDGGAAGAVEVARLLGDESDWRTVQILCRVIGESSRQLTAVDRQPLLLAIALAANARIARFENGGIYTDRVAAEQLLWLMSGVSGECWPNSQLNDEAITVGTLRTVLLQWKWRIGGIAADK
ncbi:MAG: hypothetical protein U0575_06870 [Phycisphaerales bacterium]